MRITLSIDDDVLNAVRIRARHENRTMGGVLSELAREALTRPGRPTGPVRSGFPILPSRGHTVTSSLVDQVLNEGGQ